MGTVRYADLTTSGPTRFSTLSALDGTEVIDNHTGHPVARLDSPTFAELECDTLNAAAVAGPKALARALGAIEETE